MPIHRPVSLHVFVLAQGGVSRYPVLQKYSAMEFRSVPPV